MSFETTSPNTGLISCGQSVPTGLASVAIRRPVGDSNMSGIDHAPVHWSDIGIPDDAQKAWCNAAGHFISRNIEMVWELPEFDWRSFLGDRYTAFYDLYNGFHDGTPIENIMAGWLCFLDGEWLEYPVMGDGPWADEPKWHSKDRPFFGVSAQQSIGSYRVDFLIVVNGQKGLKRLAIECDGHDFHEKTKQQAARDKRRDREILTNDVPIMRFTGSEIWNDPAACLEHVQEVISRMVWDVFELPKT